MNNKKFSLDDFDYAAFRTEAIEQIKKGHSLIGKDGILTPLIKEILESALEGEMDSHLSECRAKGESNRRNGKMTKLMKTATSGFDVV